LSKARKTRVKGGFSLRSCNRCAEGDATVMPFAVMMFDTRKCMIRGLLDVRRRHLERFATRRKSR
jgi:hypothetical protein